MSINISGASANPDRSVAVILTPEEAAADETIIDHPAGMYAMIVGDRDDMIVITGTLEELRLIIATLARQHNQLSGRS